MKVVLTKGMDGQEIELIKEADSINDAIKAVHEWKDKHFTDYKVEKYDRLLFKKEEAKVIIDFGDYSCFITIEVGKDNWSSITDMFV